MLRFQPGANALRHAPKQDAHGRPTLSPVDLRAHKVHSEYFVSAHKLDCLHYSHFSEEDQRPVYSRLLEYGDVRGLIVAAFGSFSEAGHELLDATILRVQQSITGSWQSVGACIEAGAKSIFALQYRRQHGCAASLGFSKI